MIFDIWSVVAGYMDDYTLFFFALLSRELYRLRKLHKREYNIRSLIQDKRFNVEFYKLLYRFNKLKFVSSMLYIPINNDVIKYIVSQKHYKYKKDIDQKDRNIFTLKVVKGNEKYIRYLLEELSNKYIDKKYLSEYLSKRFKKKEFYISF